MNNNLNFYINDENNQNYNTFLLNNIENKNIYNRINHNNNIPINCNFPNMSFNYQEYISYLYKQNNIIPSEIKSYNMNYINKIYFLQNQNLNFKNINNNFINNNKLDSVCINQDINYYNSLEPAKVKNDNISKSNNYYNNFNNINNINNNENGYKNNYFNYLNYLNSVNINSISQNNIYEFMKYVNSLPIELVNFLCTPKGISEVQKKLEQSNNKDNFLLVHFLNKQGLSKIMKDTYGNYFFQKLIKNKEKSLISLILSYISEDFIDISKNFAGTFSLQALLDEISSIEEEQKILNYIKNYEMEMAFNQNATHVLQKIVLLFPDYHRIYLNEVILNNFIELFLDSNGICLIKTFIKTNTLINNKKRINNMIINNFITLAKNPFGNYGIQYLMEIWEKEDLQQIKEKIIENIYKLSLHQFSSNVIEKAIEIFDEENKIEIIKKVCFDKNFIIKLIKNKFGKFVLDKAIKYMKFDIKKEFEINLWKNINNNAYKNKDKNKIKRLISKLNNDIQFYPEQFLKL